MVYLELFHGRTSPSQELRSWGSNGPYLGPLAWVHTTYACHVRACPVGGRDGIDIPVVDDLLYYDGVYYGDWSIWAPGDVNIPSDAPRFEPINESKAQLPASTGQRNANWNNSGLQFTRLLAELYTQGITPEQMQALQDSMDATHEDIHQLFVRARDRHEAHVKAYLNFGRTGERDKCQK